MQIHSTARGGVLGTAVLVVAAALAVGCGGGAEKMKSYPEGTDGLKAMMVDLEAKAQKDEAAAVKLAESLILKDHEKFFVKHFGDEVGKKIAEEYAMSAKSGAKGMVAALKNQRGKGRTEYLAEKFEKADDEMAVGYQQSAIEAMKEPIALYSFRAVPPGKTGGWHLYNFAWVDGGWKLIGPMKMTKPQMLEDPKMDALASLRAKEREEFFKSGTLPD